MEDSMQGAVAASSATAVPSARTWRRPQLNVLGEVGSLTESGSRNGMEDGVQNGFCNTLPIFGGPLNMTYNMC